MPCRRLNVWKLGSSVLTDTVGVRRAAHDVYRSWAEGESLVLVVSALSGRTDALLTSARAVSRRSVSPTLAAEVARGETESACLLGLHLDRLGVPVSVLSPGALSLRASGPALEADPVSVDVAPVERALGRGEVVLVPGYCALDEDGRTVLLGRGGSDLSALFLADALKADRCLLAKDVDALYTRDPRSVGPPLRRYARASFDDALATDGSIVQHRAVRFAAARGRSFGLGRLGGRRPTVIGSGSTEFGDRPESSPRTTVALLGLGTVGAGVLELLSEQADRFELIGVAVRRLDATRDIEVPTSLLTTDTAALASSGADLVVDTTGSPEAATWFRSAIAHGSRVVTADKAALAAAEPAWLLSSLGGALRGSAAAGGSVPVLERLAEGRAVRSVRGLLNGTTNFVLDELQGGRSLDEALTEARAAGYAEEDASRDLHGLDAAAKLIVIARTLGDETLAIDDVGRDELGPETVARLRSAWERGAVVRQVATLESDDDGRLRARVELAELNGDDPLHDVCGVEAAVVIELADGEHELLHGFGAGRWPTAASVLGDVLALTQEIEAEREALTTAEVSDVA
ncbi:MAG: hypothetical protein AAF533_23065 [Acidobacteriota bacterium]